MKRLMLIALLVSVGFALAGCASGGGKHSPTTAMSVTTTQSYPQRSTASPLVLEVGHKAVGRIDLFKGVRILSPTRLGVVTWGSSGCAATPKRLIVQSTDVIRINLVVPMPKNAYCPADYGPTPFILSINPKQIDVHKQLTIRLYYPRTKKPLVRVAPSL